MSFGPEVIVNRVKEDPRRASSVLLAPYTETQAAALFPYPLAGVQHVGTYLYPLLRASTPGAYLADVVDADDRCAWGVWDDRYRLAGLAAVIAMDEPNIFGFHIALRPEYHGRGVGGLAVAGIVRATLTPGALAAANPEVSATPRAMVTSIHPENTYSQRLCRHAGFVEVSREIDWWHYRLATEGFTLPEAGFNEEVAAASTAVRQQNETRYTIDVRIPPEPYPTAPPVSPT